MLFQNSSYGHDSGNCLLLSEKNLILLTEDLADPVLAFFKIQDNYSEKRRRIITAIASTIAGLSITSIFVSAVIWKKCKKHEEPLFDGIPGTPKWFSFHELKVATRNFSTKLGVGGFGSVFKAR